MSRRLVLVLLFAFLIGVSVGWAISQAGLTSTPSTQSREKGLLRVYESSTEDGLVWRFSVYESSNSSGDFVRFDIFVPLKEPELTLRLISEYRFVIAFGDQTIDDWIAESQTREARHTVGPLPLAQIGRELPLPGTLTVLERACSKYGCKLWRTDATVVIFSAEPTEPLPPEPQRVSAQIVDFTPATGTYKPGDAVTSSVTIKNTGNTDWIFYMGYSVQDKNGRWYNVSSVPVAYLAPGQTSAPVSTTWTVPSDAAEGPYTVAVAISFSEGHFRQGDTSVVDYREQSNSFQIVRPAPSPNATLSSVTLPDWWRDLSASFFRISLFVTVILFLRTWTNLDKTK